MEERRHLPPRSPMLKAGRIVIDRISIVDCVVRNRSRNGACLIVPCQLGVPQRFELGIDREKTARVADVIWRRKDRLGVKLA